MEPIAPILDRVVADKRNLIPTASARLDDGRILEMVIDPKEGTTRFIIGSAEGWESRLSLDLPDGRTLVPYSPRNNLLRHKVLLFPSEPEEYGTDAALITAITAFIHRHVDVSPLFEKLGTYYVLLSWVFDAFHELPYLRVRGEPGSGKTRFLQTVGSLCNKPIFASGASTVAPIFRILDAFSGTLIIDESDFRMSDEKAEVVKILNNGNVRGFPVLRAEANAQTKEFNPRAYDVFGPKILASRGFFEDKALESRFLTEEMGTRSLRDDVPMNLPRDHGGEALHLRNQLLLFRFRNLRKPRHLETLVDRRIEPRLNQVLVPLLSIIEDPLAREDLYALARALHHQMILDRGLELDGQLLAVIQEQWAAGPAVTVKDITNRFLMRHATDYPSFTPKKVGWFLRKKLGLATERTRDGYVLVATDAAKLARLYERYGIEAVDTRVSTTGGSAVDNPKESRTEDHQEW